nr:GPCR kinase [Tanacetum cinerariifolium]
MACSLSHTDYEVEALVQKLIDEDKVHPNTIMDLALQFENACTVKDDLRKAYEKCNDIPQESRALIDTFLKECSDKDYELNLSMYGKAAKLEKQMDAKLARLLEKYYCCSQTHIGCLSSQADLYLTAKELQKLHLNEEALRETLEEKTMDEKAREEKIRQKRAEDDEFFLEFGVVRYDSEYDRDIDDSDLHLTHVLRSSSSTRVEPHPSTPNPVRIIPGLAVHYKVIGEGGYRNDITVGADMILANVSVFSPKPLMHYHTITRKNVVKVFRKDTVPRSGGG